MSTIGFLKRVQLAKAREQLDAPKSASLPAEGFGTAGHRRKFKYAHARSKMDPGAIERKHAVNPS